METLTPEQIKVAEQLRKEIRVAYPYISPVVYAIEYFVVQSWSHPERLTVHTLYDHLLSQGYCEVEQ